MNSLLMFLLKSTIILSLLYLIFSVLLRNDTFFALNRRIFLFLVLVSIAIPFIHIPDFIQNDQLFQLEPFIITNNVIEEPIPLNESSPFSQPNSFTSTIKNDFPISLEQVILIIYWTGVAVSFLFLTYSLISVFMLFRGARKRKINGVNIRIVDVDFPAFTFGRTILISEHDYQTNWDAIITHELSHIRKGHLYDLVLMEFVKIVFWFNPFIYKMYFDLKEIHEFEADDFTLNSGIDRTQYQLLIIQKCVGNRKFALANSFNHSNIKNRINMMNKPKTAKTWRWKLPVFLPLLALLLLAFGKKGEYAHKGIELSPYGIIPEQPDSIKQLTEADFLISGDAYLLKSTRKSIRDYYSNEKQSFSIEIREDGNYIDNKLVTLSEIQSIAENWQRNNSEKTLILWLISPVQKDRLPEVKDALRKAKVKNVDVRVLYSKITFDQKIDNLSEFSMGILNLNKWISQNLNYQPSETEKNIEGIVYTRIIIDEKGKVKDVYILRGINPDLDEKVWRLLSSMTKWDPGKYQGKSMNVQCYIPVHFDLSKHPTQQVFVY